MSALGSRSAAHGTLGMPQECVPSQFWGLEVQGQGVSLALLQWL
jgi:hypothetical protein